MESDTSAQRVPQRIGRYTDLHVLGRGGMGIVYRGYDPELDRPVAIKVMLQSTPDFVARFRREAQSIARLTHPNVVQVYDFGVDEAGNPYFVMELVEGTALDKMLERGGLPITTVVDIARQAALGLAAAHRAAIIHRDVKPSNLMIDARGGVKLVDFGIARATTGAQLTAAASLMGTPGYMAPEQAQGKAVDHRADIYALGLTIFEMIAGDQPFHADDPIALVVMNMQEPLPDLRRRVSGVPEALVELVEKMGAKNPDARVQSCDAVVRALDAIALGATATSPRGNQGVAVGVSSVPPTNVRPLPVAATGFRRKPGMALAAALAVGGIGVALVLALAPAHHDPVVVAPPPKPAPKPDPAPPPKPDPAPSDGKDAQKIAEQATRPAAATGPLRMAVLEFQNVGKDPALEQMAAGIAQTVVTDLGTVGRGKVQLVERSDLESDIGEIDRGKDDHFDKATLAQRGKLEGVHVAVLGGVQHAGNVVRLTARFVRVETGEILDSVRVDGTMKHLLDMQDELGRQLGGHLLALVAKERPAPDALDVKGNGP